MKKLAIVLLLGSMTVSVSANRQEMPGVSTRAVVVAALLATVASGTAGAHGAA